MRHLGRELLERGERTVALDHHGERADRSHELAQKCEHGVGDRMGVRIDVEAIATKSARDVDHLHPIERVAGEHARGVLAGVQRVGVEVREVEQHVAPGRPHDFAVEARLVEIVVRPAERPGCVLEEEGYVREDVARAVDIAREHPKRLACPRKLGEVTYLSSSGSHECDVLRDVRGTEVARQLAETGGVLHVHPLGASEGELHPMGDDRPDA